MDSYKIHQNNKNVNLKFFKILSSSIAKSIQTYVYLLIFPFVCSLLIYLLKSHFDTVLFPSSIAIVLITTPVLGSMILTSLLLTEWKNSIFMRHVKIMGISKNSFLVSVSLIMFITALIGVYLNWTLLTLTDLFLKNKSFIGFWNGFKFWSFILINISIMLYIVLCIFVSTLISISVKNIIFSQLINAVIILFALYSAEYVIRPDSAEANRFYFYVGFLSFFKYATWAIMMSGVNITYSSSNVIIFMNGSTGYELFKDIWTPLILLLVVNICLFSTSLLTFKFASK